jgi:hypothetical protein
MRIILFATLLLATAYAQTSDETSTQIPITTAAATSRPPETPTTASTPATPAPTTPATPAPTSPEVSHGQQETDPDSHVSGSSPTAEDPRSSTPSVKPPDAFGVLFKYSFSVVLSCLVTVFVASVAY